jgi:hypothetical protein
MTAYASEHEEALAIEKKRDVDMAEGCAAVKEWERVTGRTW